MTNVRVIKPALAALVAAAACAGGLAFSSAQPAQADTYSDLINAQNQHAASVQREAELKQQLAGASQDLANKVLELDDLTNNKIVAAQAKVTQANEDARFVLPNACETKMVVTMNARSLQNFFHLRCCSRAQWEIRQLAEEMFRLVYPVAPHIFAKAGPACVSGPCPEGKMCCGRTAEVRAKYEAIKQEAGV